VMVSLVPSTCVMLVPSSFCGMFSQTFPTDVVASHSYAGIGWEVGDGSRRPTYASRVTGTLGNFLDFRLEPAVCGWTV
jgi:hypothetical protein